MKPESSVVFFPCRDMEETRAYYANVLGLPIAKDLGHTVWFSCGFGYLAFVCYNDGRDLAKGACISFNLPSRQAVDEAYQTMKAQGNVLGLNEPPREHPRFPVYSFFFTDPNGYTLEIQKTDE